MKHEKETSRPKIKNTSRGNREQEEEERCPTESLLGAFFYQLKEPENVGFACEKIFSHARNDND